MKRLVIDIKASNNIKNYLYSYRHASNLLYKEVAGEARKIVKRKGGDPSSVIPYLFCLRHSLELAIKVLLIEVDSSIKKVGFTGGAKLHNLKIMYDQLVKNLPEFAEIKQFKHLVVIISNFDLDGKYFVYPINKKLKQTLRHTKIEIDEWHKAYNEALDEYTDFIQSAYPDLFS